MILPVLECPDVANWSARIRRNTQVTPANCWEWTLSLDHSGYGKFSFTAPDGERRRTGSHRAAWLAMRGPIPEGLQIDHLCRNRKCCNPEHLEVVTPKVNSMRAMRVGPEKRGTKLRGCGKHWFSAGKLTPRGGSVVWLCRPCIKARRDRFLAARK